MLLGHWTTKRHVRAVAILCLLQASAAAAEHHGQVLFNGLPVPGASVTATQGGKRFETVTDAQGLFQFPDIPSGAWTVRVETLGFAVEERTVQIDASTPASAWELKMQPLAQLLAASRAVAVAPPKPLLPHAFTSNDKVVKADASAATDTSAARPAQSVAERNDLLDRNDGGMLINGSENNAATSKYSTAPAFGTRRPGAKNLFTGGVGAIVSNSNLDARPYSITGLQFPKASYTRFTGLASVGGPVRIPHILQNGPTFFLGYQWGRDTDAQTLSGLMPTAAQREGNLSTTPLLAKSASLATPADTLAISPQAQALLQLYPLPNLLGSTTYNYQTQVLSRSHSDSLQSRLDKGFGRRDQVYGGFAFRSVRGTNENIFHFLDTTNTLGIDSNVNWSHRFPRQILFDFGYRFSRFRTQVLPNFANVSNVSGSAGIMGNEQSPTNWGPPTLAFSSGIAALTDGVSAFNRNRTDRFSASATWTHRKHVVTIGGDVSMLEFNQLAQANPRGSFTFTGNAAAHNGSASSHLDLADFLLGTPDTSSIAFGNADKYFRQKVYDAFATDDWRVLPELTINSGVRWDYGAPLTEIHGRLVNLDVTQGFGAIAPVLGSDPVGLLTGVQYPSSLVRPDKSNIQPRVGISWRPFPTASTVVRGGYGIYVDTSVYLPSTQQMAQQAPLSKSLNVAWSNACPITLADGFESCAGTTPQAFGIDPKFRVGYAQTWRLSAQNDLPGALVLTASYLGTKGTRGPQQFLPNTYPIGSTAPCVSCSRGFVYQTSNGNSIRHAGEVQLRRRLRSGLTATLDYVYAKSIDNDSSIGGAGYVSSNLSTGSSIAASSTTQESIAQNWLDLRAERSRSSFDQRHLLKAQAQYTTGQGLHGGALMQGWTGRFLKEWMFTGQLSIGTGLPQTPIYLEVVPGTGFTGTIRGNPTGQPVYDGTAGRHLNPAAYTAPVAGQWGTAGRNSIEGPATFSLDTAVARTFRLKDALNLDVRADATNILNHVVYTTWNTIVNSTTFGLPASTQGMRSVQVTGRLRF